MTAAFISNRCAEQHQQQCCTATRTILTTTTAEGDFFVGHLKKLIFWTTTTQAIAAGTVAMNTFQQNHSSTQQIAVQMARRRRRQRTQQQRQHRQRRLHRSLSAGFRSSNVQHLCGDLCRRRRGNACHKKKEWEAMKRNDRTNYYYSTMRVCAFYLFFSFNKKTHFISSSQRSFTHLKYT